MVNAVCMFLAGDCGCVSAVGEAICINQGKPGEYWLRCLFDLAELMLKDVLLVKK